MTPTDTVNIDLDTALIIRRAFVPHNPRRMRNPSQITLQAALRFIELVEMAERERLRTPPSAGEGRTE